MSNPTVDAQVAEFDVGFNSAVGPKLAEVFATEQRDLVAGGPRSDIVSVGDRISDTRLLTAEGSTMTLAAELTADDLLAISPQAPDGSAATIDNRDLGFRVLSDVAGVLIRGLGIVTEPSTDARAAHAELGFDVADSNADGTAAIPFPTVLIVDRGHVVQYADVQVDYTRRTEVDEVLAAVDVLGARAP